VRLTIARYYTPTGRCIQRPYSNGKDDYYEDFYERFHNGEIKNADSIHFNDSLKYTTPGGRTVYGGGGIMPDIYVPYDADQYPEYYNKLLDRGLIFRYAFQYTDTHRQKLSDYENFDDFQKYFTVHKGILLDFIAFAEEKGVPEDADGIRESDQRIKTLIKAYIGRNLFDDDGFYPVYHVIDETFQKAMEYLASGEDRL
jgi:carboxyl-terminal processing protease